MDPCRCHACTVAGVTTPSITIPAWRQIPARELHGVELIRHVEAQNRLRATIAAIAHKKAAAPENAALGATSDIPEGGQHA